LINGISGYDRATAKQVGPSIPDDLAAPFGLDRFLEGRMIDENVAAAVAR
jgi:hypothetical protein